MTRIANAHALANALLRSVMVICLLALGGAVAAQQFTGAGSPQSPPDQTAASKTPTETQNAALLQFSWLAGHWQGQWGPRLAQQVWMPGQSGTMVGVFQLSENTKTLVVELYTIVSTPRGIELRIRRFTPSLTAWEKSEPALLELQSADSKSLLFENADNGQPKSWLMTRTGPDSFVERFEIVPKKGQQQVARIVYHRQPASAPPNR